MYEYKFAGVCMLYTSIFYPFTYVLRFDYYFACYKLSFFETAKYA